MIPLEGGAKRISTLHKNLIESGALKKFESTIEPFAYEPLNDSQMVANEIMTRFGALLKGSNG